MLPLTFAILAILTGALVLLRLRWSRLSHKTKRTLVTCACAALGLYAFSFATGWSTSSNHLNATLYWFAMAGYEFFILLFTLLRPRWLTTIIAIVLLLPIFSASPFLPLTDIFNTAPHTIVSIGPNLISDRAPSGVGTTDRSGFDLTIYSHPSWTHFFRRRRQASHYFSEQCDASRASATLQPDHKHVLMSCPAAPNQQPDAARNLVVKLY
jgi:hypothetical protein